MPFWPQIIQLRNDLRALRLGPHVTFDMSEWVEGFLDEPGKDAHGGDIEPDLDDLRLNGSYCSTAGCLAGWAVIWYSDIEPETQMDSIDFGREGEKILGLTSAEADYMFGGWWGPPGVPLNAITKKEAVQYLNLAIKEKNIRVRLPRRKQK